ncbi:MAG TPA: SH3 domain-containing protein [Bacillota bacterium]|nr:SH3 domain-containing protein [Bacillota bacterium]
MWLTQLSENLSGNVSMDSFFSLILMKVSYLWFWAIIAGTILTALLLVVTLAHIEAGTGARSRWLTLTLCSLAVTAGLIVFKPRVDLAKANYRPASPSYQETVEEPEEKEQKGIAPGSSGGGREQTGSVPGKVRSEPDLKGPDAIRGTPSIQEQLGQSLQKMAANGKFEYKDPVLEEILELKRRAEEESKEADADENPAAQSGQPASGEEQQAGNEPGGQQAREVVKARVLVSPLNIREKGSLDGRIVGSLRTGEIVEVINQESTGEWVRIRLKNGQAGWVNKKYLQFVS